MHTLNKCYILRKACIYNVCEMWFLGVQRECGNNFELAKPSYCDKLPSTDCVNPEVTTTTTIQTTTTSVTTPSTLPTPTTSPGKLEQNIQYIILTCSTYSFISLASNQRDVVLCSFDGIWNLAYLFTYMYEVANYVYQKNWHIHVCISQNCKMCHP